MMALIRGISGRKGKISFRVKNNKERKSFKIIGLFC